MPANGEATVRLTWDQITAVYAYKRDCVTLDQIRLVFGDDNRRMWMEVSEDDSGYRQLVMGKRTGDKIAGATRNGGHAREWRFNCRF